MNSAVISIAITLGVAILPLQVTAAERSALTYSAGHVHKQQHDWQRHREHRREAIPHRNSYNQLGIKTDHRAVKKRLAAQRLKHRRHHKSIFQIPEKYLSITMGATVASITTIGVGIPIVISMTGIIWNGWQLWLCSTAFTQTDHIRLLLQIP